MNILKTLQERYTTKRYDPTLRLSEGELQQIREILHLAPSSINSQPWAFDILSDEETKARLSEHSMSNRERVQMASHIIVLNVYRSVQTFEEERLPTLTTGAQSFYRSQIAPRGEEGVRSWMERQVYIALGVLLTALPMMGIDSTPMEGIELEAYDAILGHEKYRPLVAVALGRRDPEDENQPSRTPKNRRTDVFL